MSLLWKIEQGNAIGASYLFGTMHVSDGRAFSIANRALPYLRETQVFAAEMNLSNMGGQMDAGTFTLPEGQSLKELISEKKYQKLKRLFMKAAGVNLDHFLYTLPLLTANMLTEQMLRSDMELALDEYLWNYATEQGHEMQGIETLNEQLEVLKEIPIPTQVKMLLDSGRSISHYRKKVHHLIEMYEKGDIHHIYKSVKRNAKGLRKMMLYRRNHIMAKRVAALVAGKTAFVAIGAGHLAGGHGVIRLLKKRGLTVKPIRLEENKEMPATL